MDTTQKPTQTPEVFRQELDSEIVLYDSNTRKVHILNQTAERIWELCDGTHTVSDIAADLRTTFAAPPTAPIENDVANTVEDLTSKGLLQV